jgi:small-conductance mechanosensitive channel
LIRINIEKQRLTSVSRKAAKHAKNGISTLLPREFLSSFALLTSITAFLQTCKGFTGLLFRNFNDLRFGTDSAIYRAEANEKEGTNMKNTIAKKGAYIGAGAGLVLFAIFGLLPGSLLGGAAGINVAGWLFGLPLEPGIISRAIVLISMLVGVLVAGIVIVTATTTIGWLAGRAIEGSVAHDQKEAAAHK